MIAKAADRAIKSKGMDTIDFLHGVATSPMTAQTEFIENKLLDLAIDGDTGATQQYADLYLSRLNWERTRSAEHRQDFLDQAQDAQAWLAVNSL
jgi:hypothetical protein